MAKGNVLKSKEIGVEVIAEKNDGINEIALKFAEMKKMMEEAKKLEASLKASLSKDEFKKMKAETISKKRVTVIPDSLKEFGENLKKLFTADINEKIASELKKTVTAEKPEGNKSLGFKVNDSYSIAIIKSKKVQK